MKQAFSFIFCGLATAAPMLAEFRVHGAIAQKYAQLGGPRGFLGAPRTHETATPDGIGRFNHFANGSIYWTPTTGAHEVHGYIREKWASLGWERSPHGYPLTDELPMPDGKGKYNAFQLGSIYWSPTTGAHTIVSAIAHKWIDLGEASGFLGYPVTDEARTPDRRGRFVHFEGGSIYLTPRGAFEVHGAIRARWAALGWEAGRLGFPTSDEFQDGAYRRSNFERGYIHWSPATGARVCCSAFGRKAN